MQCQYRAFRVGILKVGVSVRSLLEAVTLVVRGEVMHDYNEAPLGYSGRVIQDVLHSRASFSPGSTKED